MASGSNQSITVLGHPHSILALPLKHESDTNFVLLKMASYATLDQKRVGNSTEALEIILAAVRDMLVGPGACYILQKEKSIIWGIGGCFQLPKTPHRVGSGGQSKQRDMLRASLGG